MRCVHHDHHHCHHRCCACLFSCVCVSCVCSVLFFCPTKCGRSCYSFRLFILSFLGVCLCVCMFVCVLEETLPEPRKHMMVLVMGTRVINDPPTCWIISHLLQNNRSIKDYCNVLYALGRSVSNFDMPVDLVLICECTVCFLMSLFVAHSASSLVLVMAKLNDGMASVRIPPPPPPPDSSGWSSRGMYSARISRTRSLISSRVFL